MNIIVAFGLWMLSFTLHAQQNITLSTGSSLPAVAVIADGFATSSTIPSPGADLYIFHYSETVQPGEEISVQGQFPANATLRLALGAGTTHIAVPIQSQGVNVLTAKLPATLPRGIYRIWVQNAGGSNRSGYKYINRATGDIADSPITYSGATMALEGHNLMLPGRMPTIRFISVSTGVSSSAAFIRTDSDEFKLNFIAPTLVTGQTYQLYVSNGEPGASAEVSVPETVTAVASQRDVWNLGVAWHALFTEARAANIYNVKTDARLTQKAVGNGATNDYPAIQAALTYAGNNGGGVVFLPAGTYRIEKRGWPTLDIPSNVVLQGGGKDLTLLRYGYSGNSEKFIYVDQDKANVGVADLSIENVNTTVNQYTTCTFNPKYGFFKNVRWAINSGNVMEMFDGIGKGLAIINCDFSHKIRTNNGTQANKGDFSGLLTVAGTSSLIMRKNTFTFASGVNVNQAKGVFIEDNIFNRDASITLQSNNTIHLLAFDWVYGSLIRRNKFNVINGPLYRISPTQERYNDGETILAEGGGAGPTDIDKGNVTSATLTTLTYASANWDSAPLNVRKPPYVSIIAGKGVGQVRAIRSRTRNTLTVPAWDVIPDGTSVFCTYVMATRNTAIVENELYNQQRGIQLYFNAGQQVYVVKNKLYNSGGIEFTATMQDRGAQGLSVTPMYDLNINDNLVDGSTDKFGGAYLGIVSIQFGQTTTWGTSVYNFQARRNILIGNVPNLSYTLDPNFPSGYHAHVLAQATTYKDVGIPAILAPIFSNNTAQNIENTYWINRGTHHAVISTPKQINATSLIQTATPGGAAGGAGAAYDTVTN